MLEVSKYIHNNPIKAGITEKPEDYPWSSYNHIIRALEAEGLVDGWQILRIISDQKKKAIEEYILYVSKQESNSGTKIMKEDVFLAPWEENRVNITNKQQAQEKLRIMAEEIGISLEELINNQKLRNEAIRKIRINSTLTLKEIGEMTGGLSESRVSRILGKA
ncbi:MAG: hypothetical protein ACOWWO_15940 [Peptococcaceae bacterium]